MTYQPLITWQCLEVTLFTVLTWNLKTTLDPEPSETSSWKLPFSGSILHFSFGTLAKRHLWHS